MIMFDFYDDFDGACAYVSDADGNGIIINGVRYSMFDDDMRADTLSSLREAQYQYNATHSKKLIIANLYEAIEAADNR